MRMRLVALFGLSTLVVAGMLGVAERASIAQSPPDQPAMEGAVPSIASPTAPSVPAPARAPAVTPAPAASPAPSAPAPAAPDAAPAAPAPVVTAPPVAPAPVVTAPPAQTPAPVVTAPTVAPSPVVTAPPLPQEKPASEAKKKTAAESAKQLFAEKKLPSIGKAMAIGYYQRGCLHGDVLLLLSGLSW